MLGNCGKKVIELIGHLLGDVHIFHNKIMKCIQVALLSVQDKPSDRPIMSDIVSMLFSEAPLLATPKQPQFQQQQQQQLSHLSQVFRVGCMNQKRITPDQAHGSPKV